MNPNPGVFPLDVILFRDEKGIDHIYKDDPLIPENAKSEIKNAVQRLYSFAGRIPTRQNPLLARVKVYSVNRTMPFSPEVIVRVRKKNDVHLMDKDGNLVSINNCMTNDGKFPYIGTVLNTDGVMLETRTYSVYGNCSDEDPMHSIIVVSGPCPLKGIDEQNT